MSIHGNQYILPLFLDKNKNYPILEENDELILAFYLLSKELRSNEKILSFSRLLWPFLSIQGLDSTHIILDGLKFFSKKGKITNAPRKPLIGHVLRNIENKSKTELLDTIKDILTYKDKDAKEVGVGEESEYQILTLEALTNPEFLSSLLKLLPHLDYKPIKGFVPLDTNLTTESALDLAENYRNIITTLKGNAHRWETLIALISNEIDKWILDYNVQEKDINLRYDSQLKKASTTIDEDQIKKKLELEKDKVGQWKIEEKKKLAENISTQFMTLERILEEIVKRNRFYCSSDVLKRNPFSELIQNIERHFRFLEVENNKFTENLMNINEKVNEIIQQEIDINNKAQERLTNYENDLNKELNERDNQISLFQKEKEEKINNIQKLKVQIEDEFTNIKNIIQNKIQNCSYEIKDLQNWSLDDNKANLFAKPIQWIYMPLYVMFIEDESMMEEKMKIILPGYINIGFNCEFEDISEVFINLKKNINDKAEDDVAFRSNFEFSVSSMNILKDPNLEKRIQEGLSILRNKKIINEEIEGIVREKIVNKIKK